MTSAKNIAERYDPVTNTWETLNSMSVARVRFSFCCIKRKTLCDWWYRIIKCGSL